MPSTRPFEAAAGEDVDVGRAFEIALFVGVEAVAVAGAVHATRIVRQGGRQVLGGGKVILRGGVFRQPDPGGPQPQRARRPARG